MHLSKHPLRPPWQGSKSAGTSCPSPARAARARRRGGRGWPGRSPVPSPGGRAGEDSARAPLRPFPPATTSPPTPGAPRRRRRRRLRPPSLPPPPQAFGAAGSAGLAGRAGSAASPHPRAGPGRAGPRGSCVSLPAAGAARRPAGSLTQAGLAAQRSGQAAGPPAAGL